MWKAKAKVIPVTTETLGTPNPKTRKRFRVQRIPETTLKIFIQKSAILGTAKILRRTLHLADL